MMYPEDERIRVSDSVHSLAVSKDITTPGYTFPSQNLINYQKPFLAAGMQGLAGCGNCGMGTLEMSDLLMIGLLGMLVIPHWMKKR